MREEMKPKWIEDDTLNTMKKGVRHLKSVIQKDFLETCLRKGLFTSEVTSVAKKVFGEHEGKKKDQMIKDEKKRIMKIRIMMKKEEIKRKKLEWSSSSIKLNKSMSLSPQNRQRIGIITQTELRNQWIRERQRISVKI